MKHVRQLKQRRIGIVAAILIVIIAAPVLAGAKMNVAMYRLFTTADHHYPKVVGTVGDATITGQYMEYAVRAALKASRQEGTHMTRAQAEKLVIQREKLRQGIRQEAAARGITVSDAAVTAFLDDEVQHALANPADLPDFDAVMAANGDADTNAYVQDPGVREIAQSILEGRQLADTMEASTPNFDYGAYQRQLAANVPVHLAEPIGVRH